MYDDERTLTDLPSPDTQILLDEIDPLDSLPVESPLPDPEVMLPLLSAPDHQQRMDAVRVFCELQDARAIPALIELLGDACPLMRVSAAYALGRNPSPDAVSPLIQRLQADWNGYVRKGVVWALGNSGDRQALAPLLKTLKTDIAAVRLWAASALGQMAEAGYDAIISTIPPLIDSLRRDTMAVVRSNCAWSIGQLCRDLPSNVVYATAVDALIEAMVEDDDMSVREDAKASLLKLGDPRALQMIEALQHEGLLW